MNGLNRGLDALRHLDPESQSSMELQMGNMYWADWYSGWGWFLWFGVMILLFSSVGNWGYTYRVHRSYGRAPQQEALDILNQRYARGEITHAEYGQMKSAMSDEPKAAGRV